jgi:hypothetical protein
LAYSLKRSKNCNKEESGRKGFWIDDKQEKGGAFFWQGVLRKMYGYEAVEKKGEQKRFIAKLKCQ